MVNTGEHSTLAAINILRHIHIKPSRIKRFSESFYYTFVYFFEQKIPPWSDQHYQRSERASSLFVQTPLWLGAGNWVRLQYYLGGRFPGSKTIPRGFLSFVCVNIYFGMSIYVSTGLQRGRRFRMGSVFNGIVLYIDFIYPRCASRHLWLWRKVHTEREREDGACTSLYKHESCEVMPQRRFFSGIMSEAR